MEGQRRMTSNRPSFVYFIAAGSSAMKIGMSDEPRKRLSDLQTGHYQDLELLFTIECVNREAAFEVEGAFQRWYTDKLIRDEWYSLTAFDVQADLKLLMSLTRLVTGITQHASQDDIKRLGVKAEKKKRDRQQDASSTVREHIHNNPQDVNLPARNLAAKLGVGKSTVYDVLKGLRHNGAAD